MFYSDCPHTSVESIRKSVSTILRDYIVAANMYLFTRTYLRLARDEIDTALASRAANLCNLLVLD
jgi:hypothetical protein